ncbi:MAG: hypothetical protein ACPGYP_00025 [Solirubrobacterales bacterium]
MSVTTALAATDQIDCIDGGAIPFTVEALQQPANAETGTSSEAAALRAVLASNPAAAGLPATGWFVLARKTVDANDYVRFGNGPLTSLKSLLLLRVAGGPWRLHPTFAQSCVLRKLHADGRPSTPWNVVPRRIPMNRNSRRVWIQMTETGCASGKPAGERASVPVIEYTRTKITLVARVERPPGTQTCEENPPTYLKVKLAQRIGGRALVDGGSAPANSRLSRKQLKRIRQRRNRTSVLTFTRSQQEVCLDLADGEVTIPGLRLNKKQRKRVEVLSSRCPS